MKTTQDNELILISHKLCPYVQRAITVLEEAGMQYKRVDIDPNNKPQWFKKLSPLGKVPVLVVNDDVVLFESAVISEYINDITDISLLAQDPLPRAKQRAWIEFASATISHIAQLYSAPNEQSYRQAKEAFTGKLSQLEDNLSSSEYFENGGFSLVDASFAPIFRYLDLFEQLVNFSVMERFPKIQQWRKMLLKRPSVTKAVRDDYPQLLLTFLTTRDSYLGEKAISLQSTNLLQASA